MCTKKLVMRRFWNALSPAVSRSASTGHLLAGARVTDVTNASNGQRYPSATCCTAALFTCTDQHQRSRRPSKVTRGARHRHGPYELAATIAGYTGVNPLAAAIPYFGPPITHLRDVLGEASYETMARKGETMTIAEMANFAFDQIDQARAELTEVSK
jgi:hypothetical protein